MIIIFIISFKAGYHSLFLFRVHLPNIKYKPVYSNLVSSGESSPLGERGPGRNPLVIQVRDCSVGWWPTSVKSW
jgi:hypothetical protein